MNVTEFRVYEELMDLIEENKYYQWASEGQATAYENIVTSLSNRADDLLRRCQVKTKLKQPKKRRTKKKGEM